MDHENLYTTTRSGMDQFFAPKVCGGAVVAKSKMIWTDLEEELQFCCRDGPSIGDRVSPIAGVCNLTPGRYTDAPIAHLCKVRTHLLSAIRAPSLSPHDSPGLANDFLTEKSLEVEIRIPEQGGSSNHPTKSLCRRLCAR